ncbi:MAG TPA: hypothetical protein PKE49_01945 [Leptospiraceae bacterium]|jgi:hypothetical protein|nr:hypothetical protein [Leptospirales bacterium]HMU82177.1 hypothetical protein [Leptospiraceae bacterium]HMW59006.1 hypothetical protein [Leptospiraceae bacterium]HMX55251.1 hypothetical protein [Leptospiraceae bacterium]HMY44798.1 hypothetical protein [Leptospiraceae bacterium]
MSENPYTPSFSEVEPSMPDQFDASRAMRDGWEAFKKHLGPAMGIALVWLIAYVFAANSCFGLFALPHIFAGYSIAALALVRNRPKFELLFSAFETFGPVLVAGLYFALVYLVFIAAIMIFFFVAAFLVGFWGAALQVKDVDQLFKAEGANSPFVWFLIALGLLAFFLQFYVMARLQLVFPLVLEKKMEATAAFRLSWKLTAPASMRLTGMKVLFDFALPLLGIALCCVPALFVYPLALAVQGAVLLQYMGPGEAQPVTPQIAQPVPTQMPPPAPPQDSPERPQNPYGS